MPTLSRADLRFCELADQWKDIYGRVAYDCKHGDCRPGFQTRLTTLLTSLLDEIRKRRSDIDLRPLARLSELDVKNPPRDGSLELDIYDTTDIIGDVYTSILGSTKPGEYLGLSNPSLIERAPIICTAAALARFLKMSPNTAHLLEKLKTKEVVSEYLPPETPKGPYQIWLVDPAKHQEALEKISGKTSRR